MCANNLTYADVTGIHTDEQRDRIEFDRIRYADALSSSARAVLDGDDSQASEHAEKARRIAHRAVDHGDTSLILDQLERAYA